MDMGGKYQMLKAANKAKNVTNGVRKKAKSIGSESDMKSELKDDIESGSVKSGSKRGGRSKSGE